MTSKLIQNQVRISAEKLIFSALFLSQSFSLTEDFKKTLTLSLLDLLGGSFVYSTVVQFTSGKRSSPLSPTRKTCPWIDHQSTYSRRRVSRHREVTLNFSHFCCQVRTTAFSTDRRSPSRYGEMTLASSRIPADCPCSHGSPL